MCINPDYLNIPDHEERLDELTEHASTNADLFGTLASWLRELLAEGRQS